METDQLHGLLNWHQSKCQPGLSERMLTFAHLQPVINDLGTEFEVRLAGSSFESRSIYKIVFGSGPIRVLIWTQMHGNESTGTKTVLDLFKWIGESNDSGGLKNMLLSNCTICVIPMLNPDGSERYTRLDSQGIDLNRDVLDKISPESRLLQEVLNEFNPAYCFNMHDQRTIFSVGSPPVPATLSFLAPSEDEERTVTPGRIRTMEVIAQMFDSLKDLMGNSIGRYTDEFYPSATGDNFQRMGYPTVLVESGHYPRDYKREHTRRYTFLALVSGLFCIAQGKKSDHNTYFKIPDNEKRYLDRIVKNAKIGEKRGDIGVYFKETLVDGQIEFLPTLECFEDLSSYGADEIIAGDHLSFSTQKDAENWLSIEFI